MIPLLLAAAAVSDPAALMLTARTRLSAPCGGPACAAPPASARFRVTDDDPVALTSKDRAIRDDGSKCNVVGARRCTRRGRPIFSTGLGR